MENKSQLVNSMCKKSILITLVFVCLSITYSIDIFAQTVPSVSGAQCVSCKEMNGKHAATCPYYNKPQNSSQSPTKPLINNNQSQEQQLLFDLLFQINNQIDQWVEKEEAKQAAINEARKNSRQKIQDSISAINHQNTKQQLKGLPNQSSKQVVSNSYKIFNCKSTGNGFKIYSNGIWKEYKDCSEIDNITLNENDTIICNKGTEIALSVEDRTKIVLKENSQLTYSRRERLFMLTKGFLWAIITGDEDKAKNYQRAASKLFEIRTPSAICGIRGTTFKVNITDNNYTEILLIEGELEIETISNEERVILNSGKKIIITSDGKIDAISKLDIETLKELIKEFNYQIK